jgi:hypothetical protein
VPLASLIASCGTATMAILVRNSLPHNFIKFMYGHMIEEMLLFFTRMAGHTVEGEQKQCTVEGVRGHMDARIDGRLIDVKSTSSYGFKKFKDGTLSRR